MAFENAFERIFRLLKSEGSFSAGGIVVQDCLVLLANLLGLNASNQSLFRESGFFARLAKLLAEDAQEAARQANGDFGRDRDKSLFGLLAVLKMFLVQGNTGTQANQNAFEKQGLLQLVLNMGFDDTLGPSVRAEVRPRGTVVANNHNNDLCRLYRLAPKSLGETASFKNALPTIKSYPHFLHPPTTKASNRMRWFTSSMPY